MVLRHAIAAAQRVFAGTTANFKYHMGLIAADGRTKCFKNGDPCDGGISDFRARHPEMTVRSSENKSLVNPGGENYEHAKKY